MEKKLSQDEKIWHERYSKKNLKRLGIKTGDKILDFGCGSGNITLPAAEIVGEEGEIIAVDRDEEALNHLRQNIVRRNFGNISTFNNTHDSILDFKEASMDRVMLFDVYHELENKARHFENFQYLLKKDGDFIVYAPHVEDKSKVIKKCTEANFDYKSKNKLMILHNNNLTEGLIFKFKMAND